MTTQTDTVFLGIALDTVDPERGILLNDIRGTLNDLRTVLAEIESEIEGDSGVRANWMWEGDPDVQIVASVNGLSASSLRAIVRTTADGFSAASESSQGHREWPAQIPSETRRSFVRIINRLAKVAAITVTATDHEPVVIDPQTADALGSARTLFTERSAVDGELDVINVRGAPHFVIYEHGTGRRVRCALPDELLPNVKEALRSRVVVEGLVRYREDGSPVSIREITSLSVVEAPIRSIASLRGSLPGMTGELESGEYVRQLRADSGG